MKRPLRFLLAGLAAGVLFCTLRLGGVGPPIPPAPARWLTDRAGFLAAATAGQVDDQLQAFERSTGHQVLVYIDRTSGGVPIEDWAVRAFENWKVGRRGLDDGLVLFIMSEDRRLRIEVGYGLEATVTDIVASRIINEVIVPRIRDNDPDAAVREGVAAILEAIGGPAAEQKAEPRTRRPVPVGSPLQTFFIILVVIGFILLFITHPSLAIYLLFSMLSGGRRGGGGGGGFFGGGGRSGGGGASGSW